jgi:hypothetical protein
MTEHRIFILVAGAVLALSGAASAEEWEPKRLPDGQPDVQGFYRPEIAGTYSLVRPRRGVGVKDQDEYQKHRVDNDLSKSRIVDPPDRQVPYQPWAKAKQEALDAAAFNWTLPEHIEPQARCVPGGLTRTIFWTQDFEIRQYPGYVVFLHDGNHTSRVIPLDGRPHIPEHPRGLFFFCIPYALPSAKPRQRAADVTC